MREQSERPYVQLIGGTRPEAIKLAPVAASLAHRGRLVPEIVASGQHPVMFHQGMEAFGLQPHRIAALSRESGSQSELVSQLVPVLDDVVGARRPAAVVVQGDTTTAMAAALVAFWRRVPVVHLEAGLRSGDLAAPFPEEANRKLVTQVAALHLAPTRAAADNLYREGVAPHSVLVTGNTVVDAVTAIAHTAPPLTDIGLGALAHRLARGRRLVLVTIHRRESWHAPLRRILAALDRLVALHEDVEMVLPLHPNPVVRDAVIAALGNRDRVTLTSPLPYPNLVGLLARSTLVLSDSGGLQEEAPTFGVPVLVLREVTERREALDAGCAVLVGSDTEQIITTASRLLRDASLRNAMTARGNPFGDGRAGHRAEQALAWLVGLRTRRPGEFSPHPEGPRTSAAAVTGLRL